MKNSTVTMPWEILDRMERAVAKVRERLLRATGVLKRTAVPGWPRRQGQRVNPSPIRRGKTPP